MGVPLNAPDADEIQPECFAYEERQVERLLRQSQRCNVHSKAFSSSSSSDMMQARQTALEELTKRFSSLDYRDEWLVAATWLVDKAFSVAAGSVAQHQDSANPAACAGDIYKSKTFWLGAVLMMVKMYGAETELVNVGGSEVNTSPLPASGSEVSTSSSPAPQLCQSANSRIEAPFSFLCLCQLQRLTLFPAMHGAS